MPKLWSSEIAFFETIYFQILEKDTTGTAKNRLRRNFKLGEPQIVGNCGAVALTHSIAVGDSAQNFKNENVKQNKTLTLGVNEIYVSRPVKENAGFFFVGV